MLNIFWGNDDSFVYGPTWFKYNYELDWFSDPFIQDMMRDIDKSEYLGGYLIVNDVLGPIPPDLLSGELKTLISIYKRPDLHFDATSCGPNCAKWLLEIGNREEVTAELGYIMPFDESVSFEIRIVNTGKVVDNIKHLTYSAMPYL